jgi:hypothetical protein
MLQIADQKRKKDSYSEHIQNSTVDRGKNNADEEFC